MSKSTAEQYGISEGPDILPLFVKFSKKGISTDRKDRLNRFISRGKTDELGVESDCVLEAMTLDEKEEDFFP